MAIALDTTVLLLDLDRTLYPPHAGLQEAGDALLTAYVARMLGMTEEEAHALRRRLWAQYGTSARGLEVEHGLPQAQTYANCIELLTPADYVWPRPEVAEMLAGLPGPAWVCTNSTALYAGRVLRALGLEGCFAGVITIETMNWRAKPAPEAWQAALAHAGAEPQQVIFVDDALLNVQGARDYGLTAVLCHPQPREPWEPWIRDILELPEVLGRNGEHSA
jgi:putative hydrolase of the HAD superfamily